MKALLASTASLVALVATATPAFAQNSGEGANSVDDIIVTARRVEERLQDVPVAVTAIQGENLQRLGITNAVDLRQAVPSLTVTNAAGRPATPLYSIRGQRGSDQVFTQDPPVTAYLDEVLITPVAGSNASLFDLENVQVLKGPQGTLFGRNTTGGAVLYTSARPKDEFSAKIEAGIANYNSWKVNGYINVPFSEAIIVRAALDYKNQGGFGKVLRGPGTVIAPSTTPVFSREPGKDVMGYKQIAGRVSVLLKPADGFENLTIVGYSDWKDEGGSAFRILDTPRPGGSANVVFNTNILVPGRAGLLDAAIARQRANGDYNIESGDLNGGESKIWTATNTTTVELSDTLTLKNIFGFRKLDAWDAVDYDGTVLPILAATNSARAKTYSNETQLQGTAFNDRLNYIFGVYWFDQRGIEGTGSPFMDVRNQAPGTIAFGGAPRLQFVRIKNQALSGFGQIGYKITDSLTFNAGLRYTTDRRTSDSTVGTVSKTVFNNFHPVPVTCEYKDSAGVPLPATYAGCRIKAKASFSSPSWLLGLDWKADQDTLVYITSRFSYRSGGFQSRPFDNTTARETFKPEKVHDIEIGLKRDWDLGGDTRLRTNIAAYNQWYKDIQRSAVSLTPVGVGNVVRNAASARIRGLEFESELRFGSLARLSFNYSHIDAKFKKYPTFIFTNSVPPQQIPQDRSDFPFTYIPKHQINGSIIVTPDIGDLGDLSLTLNAYYQSKIFMGDDYNNEETLKFITNNGAVPADTFYSQKGYTLVNGRIELGNIMGSGFTAAVWGRNLFNKRYIDSAVLFQNSIGFGTGIFGPPRTYGLDVSYKF